MDPQVFVYGAFAIFLIAVFAYLVQPPKEKPNYGRPNVDPRTRPSVDQLKPSDPTPAQLMNEIREVRLALAEKYKEQHRFNAQVAPEIERLKKEFEILTARTHRLQRTVNVVFSTPIPVKMVPEIINKPIRRGRGKAAIIPEA